MKLIDYEITFYSAKNYGKKPFQGEIKDFFQTTDQFYRAVFGGRTQFIFGTVNIERNGYSARIFAVEDRDNLSKKTLEFVRPFVLNLKLFLAGGQNHLHCHQENSKRLGIEDLF